MIFNSTCSQQLDGKWILKEVGYKEFKKNIGLQILNIEDGKAGLFTDLQLVKSELDLKVKDSSLILENGEKYSDFKVIDNNLLRLFIQGTFNEDHVVMEMDFVRLLPTKTDFSQEKIQSLRFEFQGKGKLKTIIAFNQELWNKNEQEELEMKEGSRWIIEKLETIYFITNYNCGRKGVSFPISEVNEDRLKFYGVPNESGEVIATRSE